jgi:hypothetical protein
MTHPMSPSKRALLPRQEVAVTVGYWRARNDAKNSRFFRGSLQRRKHDTHPTNTCVGTGHVGRGSWGGWGSLFGVGESIVPWGGDAACQDGNCTMVWCNLLYFRWCGVIFTAGTQRLAILASQSHGEVLPPCDCEARIASMT